MTIELRKKEELTGEIWYQILINGSCEKSFSNEQEAKNVFHDIKERAKTSEWPKITPLDEFNL